MDFASFRVVEQERVLADLKQIISEGPVEIEAQWHVVLGDEVLEVVAESLHSYRFDIGLGNHQRFLVAVGGVAAIEHGVATAKRFFATLWYTPDGRLITVAFDKEAP